MNELLPCPFCGNKAEITINKSRQGQTSNVRCSVCSCRKTLLKYPNYEGDIEKDAVDDWNKRTLDCKETAPVKDYPSYLDCSKRL